MLTTQEIYNFLVTADPGSTDQNQIPPPPVQTAEVPPGPIPEALPNMPMQDDGRLESLRARLQALIGPTSKTASVSVEDGSEDSVFGEHFGEIDPTAEPLDPEWEEILEMIVENNPDPALPTVSLRSHKNISR